MFHLLHYGLMPRVVQDQSHKFETDELFRKLSEDTEIRVTSYRDKSPEERSQRFINDVKEGHTCVAFLNTGVNLMLQFYPPSGPTDKVTKEYVDFDKDPSKVVLKSRFIMNGVCVQMKGWIDLKRLDGVARLEFDYDLADQEDRVVRTRLREYEERQMKNEFSIAGSQLMPIQSNQLSSSTGPEGSRIHHAHRYHPY
ncbi:core-binding factor subunit beta-like isoform X3 [Bolinopsis microptera]|uniref:core-binding factor subunit beta-like isoform X3 n=2 Tax=Bolinopsis microptera TaxID=2820187 RepID=UPI00307AB058